MKQLEIPYMIAYIDYLNPVFYTYNVAVEFLKRYHYDYIRTNKSIVCANQY